jgi:hypothetical protein
VTEVLHGTRVLPKFLTAIGHIETPLILDLGPVVGSNVSFIGERLPCRMQIADLPVDIEASARRGSTEGLAEALLSRVRALTPEGMDAVLCWDLFDYLERPTGRELGQAIAALLRPGGVLYAYFGSTAATLTQHTRFIIQSDTGIKWRMAPCTPVTRTVWQTGDLTRLFPGLTTVDSVLLANKSREILFRKARATTT